MPTNLLPCSSSQFLLIREKLTERNWKTVTNVMVGRPFLSKEDRSLEIDATRYLSLHSYSDHWAFVHKNAKEPHAKQTH